VKIEIKKGTRKTLVLIFVLIVSPIVAWIFKGYPAVLIPLFTLEGTAITAYFGANWMEHREERFTNNKDIIL
jgi:hypothetical protein